MKRFIATAGPALVGCIAFVGGIALVGCKDSAKGVKLDDGACSLATDCSGSGLGNGNGLGTGTGNGNGNGNGLGTGNGNHAGGDAHGSASAGANIVWPTTAGVLPGTIYFRSARGMERIAKGTRELVGAGLYPSGQRIGRELVAIRSKGDGSVDAEQIVVGGKALGFAAAQVRDPAVDPAGAWIVVAAMRDGHSDLYRLDVSTGADTRLTTNVEGNFAPAVLDAKTIVFVSSRDGDSELYRMPVAGGDATRLTAFHRDDWAPTPSPDGKRIAFVSDREGTPRIFVMSAKGTDLHRLTTRTDAGEEGEPVWSPDGKYIAYVVQRANDKTNRTNDVVTDKARSNDVVNDKAGSTNDVVTDKADRSKDVANDKGRSNDVVTDKAGRSNDVVTDKAGRTNDVAQAPGRNVVVVHDVAAGTERVLTPDGAADMSPVFSADSLFVLVARQLPAGRAANDAAERVDTGVDLWAISLSDGAAVQVTDELGDEVIPRWLPD